LSLSGFSHIFRIGVRLRELRRREL
jgi:hypothetical protein